MSSSFHENQMILTHYFESVDHVLIKIIFEPPYDKTNKMACAPSEDAGQPGGIRPVRSESSLWASWVAKDPSFPHADSEDSDHTGWACHFVGFIMRRLISRRCTIVWRCEMLSFIAWRADAFEMTCSVLAMQMNHFHKFLIDLSLKFIPCSLKRMFHRMVTQCILSLRSGHENNFLRPFSPFRWFKNGSCQLLAKERTKYW